MPPRLCESARTHRLVTSPSTPEGLVTSLQAWVEHGNPHDQVTLGLTLTVMTLVGQALSAQHEAMTKPMQNARHEDGVLYP